MHAEDGSGFLTYDELSDVVRHKLKKGQKAFPEDALKALWCAIDVDDSNSVMQDEMASFFRRGAPEKKKLVKGPKEHSSASLVGSLERHGMGRALESAPTDKMREELVSAGVELPGEEELKLYAKSMNEWLEKARYVLHPISPRAQPPVLDRVLDPVQPPPPAIHLRCLEPMSLMRA